MMLRLIVVLAIACACTPALAQKKMYRCGNQFQERPCEGPRTEAPAAGAAKVDAEQQRQIAAQREQAIRQGKCENYAEELSDVERRIKAGADPQVMDQYERRRKEMNNRIARECKGAN